MKIAVTYESGNVFQHFGHTPAFKLYTVEDGKVVDVKFVGKYDYIEQMLEYSTKYSFLPSIN